MKIICLIENLGSGGAERQLTYLSMLLKKAGHDVSVVTWISTDFYASFLAENHVPHYQLPSAKAVSRTLSFIKLVKNQRPDWVISFLPGANKMGCIAKLFLPFHLIISERNFTFNWTTERKFTHYLYAITDYLVANSVSEAQNIKRHFPLLGKKTLSIPNMIDSKKFSPTRVKEESISKDRPLKIIGVGRLAPQKNIEGAIRAFKKVVETRKNCIFEWYGTGKDMAYVRHLQNIVKEEGITKEFKFMGENSAINKIYPTGDIFCLTSLWEGYPNVVVEAMSSGLPIACSNIYENPHIVQEGVNGFLFNPQNIDEIADALRKLIDLPSEARISMGRVNREQVKQKNSDKAFLAAYERLLASEQPGISPMAE